MSTGRILRTIWLSTPSLGITSAGAGPSSHIDVEAFNSLSRDHRGAKNSLLLPLGVTPLSTPSLGITVAGAVLPVLPFFTFNSLSRDHFRRLIGGQVTANELSTPSLGITYREEIVTVPLPFQVFQLPLSGSRAGICNRAT